MNFHFIELLTQLKIEGGLSSYPILKPITENKRKDMTSLHVTFKGEFKYNVSIFYQSAFDEKNADILSVTMSYWDNIIADGVG